MKIVVLDGHAANPGDLSWDGLKQYGDLTVYDRTKPEDAAKRIGDAEVIFTNKVVVTKELLDACPNLRLVSVLATGYNIIDTAAARERGVTVCNVPAYSTRDVAQMTFALLLEICHRVGHHAQTVREGKWTACPDFCYWDYPPIGLAGKTMGIVGYGQIGRAVANLAEAFGMTTLIHTRTVPAETGGRTFCDLDTLLRQSDVVSLHCPLTDKTERLIRRETLEKMKDGAILLNTGRGPLVDEQDAADALRSGKLLAMGADVVSREPIAADNPLLTAPNCFLTPHIAWATYDARQRLLRVSEENLQAFLAGTPQNVVN